MASLAFYVDSGFDGEFDLDLGGSGLGFFGSGGFGKSVAVGSYQDNTYVTDGNGINQGAQANNVKFTHANSGELSGATNLHLQDIPNANATLNIRFEHATEVQVQNAELRVYDRNDLDAGPSGVICKCYECLHPSLTQSGQLGSGELAWSTCAGSGVVLDLAQCPGVSGLYAGDGSSSTHESVRHDWFALISAAPDSIGSKTQFALAVSLEYL
jgi:hypothetical protein